MRDSRDNQTAGEDPSDVRFGEILNDFLDRRARGELVSDPELLAQHPKFADELREALDVVEDIRTSGSGVDDLVARGILAHSSDPKYLAQLGRYKITGLIGRGGMGVVLKAYEESLNRTVALKILRPDLAQDKTAIERFTREAKAAAALRHPNIITVYAVGQERGTHFIAMEHIDGPSLGDLIRTDGPLSTETTRDLFGQLLSGLVAAHESGLIHRDIKSSNILLDGPEKRVKIADFGLARILSSQTRMTAAGSIFGTPEYMSPEQARGDENIDHRSDLYSAGIVLFEMLTGRTPFKSDTPSGVIHQILNEEPADPLMISDGTDPLLASLSLRLMAKRPQDRLETANEALGGLTSGGIIRDLAWRRRILGRGVILLIGLFLLCGGASIIMRFAKRTEVSDSDGAPRIARVWIDEALPMRILAEYAGDLTPHMFHTFPPEVIRVTDVVFVDPDGVSSSGDELVVAGIDSPLDGHGLFAFDAQTKEQLWSCDLYEARSWPDCKPSTEFRATALAVADVDGAPGNELIVVACDVIEYATYVCIIDPITGEVRGRIWHLGDIAEVHVVEDYFGSEHPAIIARGVNNKLDGFNDPKEQDPAPVARFDIVSVVMVLDPAQILEEQLLAVPPASHRVKMPLALPWAYAYLDLAVGPRINHVSEGRANSRPPKKCEVASICDSRLTECPSANRGDVCVRLGVQRWQTAKGSVWSEGAAEFILDRNLELLSYVPHSGADETCPKEDWKEHWHILVQEGKFVPR